MDCFFSYFPTFRISFDQENWQFAKMTLSRAESQILSWDRCRRHCSPTPPGDETEAEAEE